MIDYDAIRRKTNAIGAVARTLKFDLLTEKSKDEQ